MKLDQVKYIVSQACNMACAHCLSSSGKAGDAELSAAEWGEVARSFADSLGVKITGGEPLMPKVLPKTVAALEPHAARGADLNVNTNGWWGWPRELDKRLGKVAFQVSLDGPREIHDAIRAPGSFGRAIQFGHAMRKRGHRVSIMSTIFPQSIAGLPRLAAQLRALDWPTTFRPAMPTGRWLANRPAKTWYDPEELRAIVRAEGGTYRDFAGGSCCGGLIHRGDGTLTTVAIDPQGYVVACPFLMEERIGHYRDVSYEAATDWVRERVVLLTPEGGRGAELASRA